MSINGHKPIRVLHVLYKMDVGGTETWLKNVLQHIDPEQFQMDILVHSPEPGRYDETAQRLGANVHYCPFPTNPWNYAANFRKILRQHGPYQIVHSHLALSGYILRLAHRAGIPVRIAHTHSDERARLTRSSLSRRLAIALSNRWIASHATLGLAVSRQAALGRFGQEWESDPRWRIFFCGVDLAPFRSKVDPAQVRRELNIPPDALVIGHVGELRDVKNHQLMLGMAAEMVRQGVKMRLLLIGDGRLRQFLEEQVSQAGLEGSVIFTGVRTDVARLLLGAMDVFLFPSLHEANPLALIEAQAAGLPCVISNCIPPETEVIQPLVQRLPLSEPAAFWVQAALSSREAKAAISAKAALEIMEKSSFNIKTNVAVLQKIYQDSLSQGMSQSSTMRIR